MGDCRCVGNLNGGKYEIATRVYSADGASPTIPVYGGAI